MAEWSHKIHKMLVLWLNQIGRNRKAHHNLSIKLADFDDLASIIIIMIISASSIGSFVNLSDFDKTTTRNINIAMGILGVVSAILTGVMKQLKFAENSQKHKAIAGEYSELSNLIQSTVLSPSKPEIETFMSLVTDRINIIQRYGPPLISEHWSIADLPNNILIKKSKGSSESENPNKSLFLPSDSSDVPVMIELESQKFEEVELQEVVIS